MGEQNVILDIGDESNTSANIWSRLSRVPLPDTNSLDDIHLWIERIDSSLAALRPPESSASFSSPLSDTPLYPSHYELLHQTLLLLDGLQARHASISKSTSLQTAEARSAVSLAFAIINCARLIGRFWNLCGCPSLPGKAEYMLLGAGTALKYFQAHPPLGNLSDKSTTFNVRLEDFPGPGLQADQDRKEKTLIQLAISMAREAEEIFTLVSAGIEFVRQEDKSIDHDHSTGVWENSPFALLAGKSLEIRKTLENIASKRTAFFS